MELPKNWRVSCHTRYVSQGSIFVAIKGQNFDGVDFIYEALRKGAKKIVVAHDVFLDEKIKQAINDKVADLILVPDARLALAQLSAEAYNWPAKKLKIIAITGTKGKTTTASLVYHMLRTAGKRVALLGTIVNKINEHAFEASLTTPQPDYLHMFFNECNKLGVDYVVMETAAQAASLKRIDGINFDVVAFTNFGNEHGEFYDTMEDYFKAKVSILMQAKKTAIVFLNKDDARVSALSQLMQNVQFFSAIDTEAHWYVATDLKKDQLVGEYIYQNKKTAFVCPSLMGSFNALNVILAVAIAHTFGIADEQLQKACMTFPLLPGRLERYTVQKGIEYVIDYAHTPESYEHVLSLLREKTNHLTVIFGAGGLRDRNKRPKMGAIAARYADRIFLTTDNPRTEDPLMIIQDILSGIDTEQKHKVIIELDREKAIQSSYQLSEKDAIIALLGKGPDEYQLIQGTKIPFSEKTIIQQLER